MATKFTTAIIGCSAAFNAKGKLVVLSKAQQFTDPQPGLPTWMVVKLDRGWVYISQGGGISRVRKAHTIVI